MSRASGRVVVTGGAGFLGRHLCERLLESGSEVVCVDNFATGMPDLITNLAGRDGFALVRADVSHGFPDVGQAGTVLHFASAASPKDYARLPVETLQAGALGTMYALDAARELGARFVLASSSEVYGDPQRHPQREDYWGNVNPVGPRSVYDEAKRYAEALTTAYRTRWQVDTGIVRIFNTYGPGMRADDGRAVPAFATQALTGRPLTVAGDGSQTRSLCYVADTIAGVLAMAGSDFAGPVNIGNDREITMLDLATKIRDLAGSSSPVEFVELPVDDPAVRCPDITLAATRLGWRPATSLDEGLRASLSWFAERLRAGPGGPATPGVPGA